MPEIHALSHSYPMPGGGRRQVLRNVDFTLREGGFHVILGRSGCGKSTLLRLMAGLETPETGRIDLDGASVGVVFQEPRLMPWMTVAQNVGFLIRNRLPRDEVARRTADALTTVGLGDVADAWPGQLSGGMAQRAAIARALVTEPRLLLMDEPFGALDAFTRKQMQEELVQLWQRFGPTVVFVTHDIEEALRLGQSIMVIEDGRFALTLDLGASYPRDGAEPAVNAARQRLIDQLFGRADLPQAAFPQRG